MRWKAGGREIVAFFSSFLLSFLGREGDQGLTLPPMQLLHPSHDVPRGCLVDLMATRPALVFSDEVSPPVRTGEAPRRTQFGQREHAEKEEGDHCKRGMKGRGMRSRKKGAKSVKQQRSLPHPRHREATKGLPT